MTQMKPQIHISKSGKRGCELPRLDRSRVFEVRENGTRLPRSWDSHTCPSDQPLGRLRFGLPESKDHHVRDGVLTSKQRIDAIVGC